MILRDISILHYRNIETANLSLSPRMNCLVGHNGAGKTNLLDAVYYLSFCRSAFNPVDSQVMEHGADFFMLEGHYEDEEGTPEQVHCSMKRGSKKHVKRNQKEYKRLSAHIGLIPLVFVSPSDALFIEGGSEERRKLMDIVIAQYDPTYIDALSRCNKALQQRNALLKQEGEPDLALLELWEEEMAAQGTLVYQKREAFVKELIPVFQDIHQQISGGNEQVSLRYMSHGQRGDLLKVIQQDRFKDLAVGYSLHGVHRDELEMLIGGYPIKREGSQGQSKSFVLALKLAQFNFLRRTSSNTTPILLLDDIFDKLDARRVEAIVKLVSGDGYGQIFITDTNRDHLDSILRENAMDYKIFEVEGGGINLKEEKECFAEK